MRLSKTYLLTLCAQTPSRLSADDMIWIDSHSVRPRCASGSMPSGTRISYEQFFEI